MAFCGHFFGKKCVFFRAGGSETLHNLLQYHACHVPLKREHNSNLYHSSCVHWGCILSFQVCIENKLTSGNRQQTTDHRQWTTTFNKLQATDNPQQTTNKRQWMTMFN